MNVTGSKVQKSHEERASRFNDVMDVGELYTHRAMDQPQRKFVHDLLAMPVAKGPKRISHSKRLRRYESAVSDSKNQLEQTISTGSVSFDFERLNGTAKQYMYRNLGKYLNDVMKTIDYNDRWMIYYEYDGKWKSKPLNVVTKDYMMHQLDTEGLLSGKMADDIEYYDDYDFFPV